MNRELRAGSSKSSSSGGMARRRNELRERLLVDPSVLSDADVEWFEHELQWVAAARVLVREALAEEGEWSLPLSDDELEESWI